MGIPNGSFFDKRLCQEAEAALLEGLDIFRMRGDKCPYFPDGRIRESLNFIASEISPAVYEALLAFGWRRCGVLFYKSLCPDCVKCRPIRVDAVLFQADRSQRRSAALNKGMNIEIGDPCDCDEDFELFARYCATRHGEKASKREEFRLFLAEPPVPSLALRHRLADGRLACVAWTDVLPGSLSAVYTAFDPALQNLGLGVFSILVQLELCRRMERRHLQLGFHIEGCRKMSYKDRYKPCHHADEHGVWGE